MLEEKDLNLDNNDLCDNEKVWQKLEISELVLFNVYIAFIMFHKVLKTASLMKQN